MFEAIADVIGDRDSLVCGDRRLTFAELESRANRLPNHPRSVGVGPGDHVGTPLVHRTEYVEALVACLKLRAVPVNVNYRYVEEELAYLYDDADLVTVITDAEYLERVRAVLQRAPKVRHLVVLGGSGVELPDIAVDYEKALAAQSDTRSFEPRSGDDIYIIYTGGTTGMPKGVMWRHEDLFFAGMAGGNPAGQPAESPSQAIEVAKTGGTMVMFPVAPLMHGAAQLGTFISFWGGNKTLLLPKFDGADVLRVVEKEKVNTINIVGDAMARPIAEARVGECATLDVSWLFVISSAGAVLSPAVQAQLTELFPNIFIVNAFGSSETGFNGSAAPGTADKGLIFVANDRTTVLDDDLKPIEPGSGTVGRVAQKRRVPVGYYKDPEKTAQTFIEIDGERWVLMGDMATIEADGTITVFGRGSVCINTGGEKVYPEEVEAALKAHPAIFDAVVAGVPDERFGERVAALVQLRPELAAPSAEDVTQRCRTLLAGYKVPRVVVFVDEVLRSPSGKADYPWAKQIA